MLEAKRKKEMDQSRKDFNRALTLAEGGTGDVRSRVPGSQADAKSQMSKTAASGVWQRNKSIPGLHSNDEEYLQMKIASYEEKMRKHAENK